MSIQFAGSKSLDDRRRRRLVVNADDSGADGTVAEEGLFASGVASELVASSAAAPWVPVYEWRIWTYAALIGLLLSGASVALAMPTSFRPELAPLTGHLLAGERPVLAVLIQTTFCFLAAQLAILIGWYRAQCKLDFRGYYRVWPWAAIAFAFAAACSATNAHGFTGQIVDSTGLLPWRGRVISWLLPTCLAALPLVVLLDRDVRRSRSSLYTLRVAWGLSLVSAWMELLAADLHIFPWIARARVILPMFVSATLFVGLWLHARVVAYICPDPPDAAEVSALSQLLAGWRWMTARLTWRRTAAAPTDADAESKPKRARRKAASDEEDAAAPKRKRKAPAKRTSKPRTRIKAAEEEIEDEEQSAEFEEPADSDGDDSMAEDESNQWEEEPTPTPPVTRSNRDSAPPSQPPSSASKKPANSGWDEPARASAESDDDDEDSEDAILRRDTGMTAEQMKGLSKRQKRELRRQSRDQQRNHRR